MRQYLNLQLKLKKRLLKKIKMMRILKLYLKKALLLRTLKFRQSWKT